MSMKDPKGRNTSVCACQRESQWGGAVEVAIEERVSGLQ